MTISSSLFKNQYTANGVNTVFTYAFKIFNEDDIAVLENDTVRTITTHYAVTGVGNDAGGTVVFVTAPTNGAVVTLKRNEPLTQEIEYTEGDDFPATAHEEGLDRSVIRDQFLQEQIDRCVKLSEGSTVSNLTFEDPTGNAGLYLKVNDDEDGFDYVDIVDPGLISVSSFMETVLDDTTAAAARTTLGALSNASGAVGATNLSDSIINDLTTVTIASGDFVAISDVSDSNRKKKALVSDITLLANPLISTQTASSSASLSFTSGLTSTYNAYVFEGTGLVPTTDDTYFIMEYSIDGGSSWIATSYVGQTYQVKGSTTINQTTPTDAIYIIPNSAGFRADSGATNDGLHFTAKLYNPSSSRVKYTKGDATWFEAAGSVIVSGVFSGCYRGGTQAINAVRFRFSSGNISTGNIKMYGLS